MAAEFHKRGMGEIGQHRDPGSAQGELEENVAEMRQLWRDVLQVEQMYCGKVLPTSMERYELQWDLRVPFLGEQPQEEWLVELDRLLQIELELDDGYRALEWYVARRGVRLEEDYPTEGYDFGSPGLIFDALQDDPDFGHEAEWRREDIRDLRDMELPSDLGLSEDLDWLVTQEWELEQAYKRLFAEVSQFAPAAEYAEEDMFWDGEQIREKTYKGLLGHVRQSVSDPVETASLPRVTASPQSVDLIDFSVEDEPLAKPAEALATGQSAASLCLQQSVARECLCEATEDACYFPAEELATGQSVASICPAPLRTLEILEEMAADPLFLSASKGGDLIDFDANKLLSCALPAETLAAVQSVASSCPAPAAAQDSQEEEVPGLSPQHRGDIQDGEHYLFSQLQVPESMDLIDLPAEDEQVAEPPAEALASGQSAANLCPAPVAVLEIQGEELGALPPQQQGEAEDVVPPAEMLPSGQSTALWSASAFMGEQAAGLTTSRRPGGAGEDMGFAFPQQQQDHSEAHVSGITSLQRRQAAQSEELVDSWWQANTGQDQLVICDLLSLTLRGEKCDKPPRGPCRGLVTGLLPRDYGPLRSVVPDLPELTHMDQAGSAGLWNRGEPCDGHRNNTGCRSCLQTREL